MKYVQQFTFIYLLTALLLSGCTTNHLVVLHTNDTHSRIEPLPESDRTAPGMGGVVRRANYIEEVRDKNKNVLLFDAGDFLQGTPYFNLFKGRVEVETMNAMNYDAVTLGNHEFDYGMEVLEQVVRLANFPFVSSNYDFSETPLKDLIHPYLILDKGGVRVGILGINIQPKGLIATSNYKGMTFLDPLQTANEIAAKLRHQYRCDVIICLSHLGYSGDQKMAASTRNIDIILGGHSHTHMDQPEKINDLDGSPVTVYQTSGRGVHVARLDVELKRGH